MQLKIAATALALATILSGCDPVPGPTPPPPQLAGSCGADKLQTLVGLPANVLATMKFAQPTRILRPGDMVTMDYSEQRLNIDIDLNETISGVRCG